MILETFSTSQLHHNPSKSKQIRYEKIANSIFIDFILDKNQET